MKLSALALAALVACAAHAYTAEPVESPHGYDLIAEPKQGELSAPTISEHKTLVACLEAAFVEARKVVSDRAETARLHCVPKRQPTAEDSKMTTEKVRAKLVVQHVTTHNWRPDARTLRLECVYDPSAPEDQRFAKATPSGHIELLVENPAALEFFMPDGKLGKAFYVDFARVPETQST